MLTEDNLDDINENLLQLLKVCFVKWLPPGRGFKVYEANVELDNIQVEEFPIVDHTPTHLHDVFCYEARLTIEYYVKNSFAIKKNIKVTISGSDIQFSRRNDSNIEY